jgi:hypothetical protein
MAEVDFSPNEPISLKQLLNELKKSFTLYGAYKIFRRTGALILWVLNGGLNRYYKHQAELEGQLNELNVSIKKIENELAKLKAKTVNPKRLPKS